MSDIGHEIKVFFVFFDAAPTFADFLFTGDEFNSRDPLDHLVAELIFDS